MKQRFLVLLAEGRWIDFLSVTSGGLLVVLAMRVLQ